VLEAQQVILTLAGVREVLELQVKATQVEAQQDLMLVQVAVAAQEP
jgi:hypothetical protein